MSLADTCGNIEKHCPTLPTWVKSAAKLLNTGEPGKDWNAVAKELGERNFGVEFEYYRLAYKISVKSQKSGVPKSREL